MIQSAIGRNLLQAITDGLNGEQTILHLMTTGVSRGYAEVYLKMRGVRFIDKEIE